jgi:hypothetical protein
MASYESFSPSYHCSLPKRQGQVVQLLVIPTQLKIAETQSYLGVSHVPIKSLAVSNSAPLIGRLRAHPGP